jgi:putative heme-binding domain-containing protein
MRIALIAVLALSAASQAPADEPREPLDAAVALLRASDDPTFQLDVLRGVNDGLRGKQGVKAPPSWEQVRDQLLASDNRELRLQAEALAVVFGDDVALESLRRQLADRTVELSTRQKALDSLLAARDAKLPGVLQQLLQDTAMRAEAIRALAVYGDPDTPKALLNVYRQLPPAERRDVVNTLAGRDTYAKELITAVRDGIVPQADISQAVVRQLNQLGNKEISEWTTNTFGAIRATSGDKRREMRKYLAILEQPTLRTPDLSNGRAIFAQLCMQCHTLYDVGGKVGPDLTGSNRADAGYLLENIIDPSAVIPNEYMVSIIRMKDDRLISGIMTAQDQDSVTVQTENETLVLPRQEILRMRQSETSMMPEGLMAGLKEDELRDFFAYMAGSQQVPMLLTPQNALTFFNGRDLTGWEGDTSLWRVEGGEIIGRSTGLATNEFLRSTMVVGDFRLVLRVKLVDDRGNSGIQFRSEPLPNGDVKGYQADIGPGWWGKLYEEHGRKLLWDKSGEQYVRPGEWNDYEILAVGHRIQTAINGNVCVDLEDNAGALRGIVALQLHSGGPTEIRFKDIRIEANPEPRLITTK